MIDKNNNELLMRLIEVSKQKELSSAELNSLLQKAIQSKENEGKENCSPCSQQAKGIPSTPVDSKDIEISQEISPCQTSILSAIATLVNAFPQCATIQELTDCEILLRALRIAIRNNFCSQALCILEVAQQVCRNLSVQCNTDARINGSSIRGTLKDYSNLINEGEFTNLTISSNGVCPGCNPGTIHLTASGQFRISRATFSLSIDALTTEAIYNEDKDELNIYVVIQNTSTIILDGVTSHISGRGIIKINRVTTRGDSAIILDFSRTSIPSPTYSLQAFEPSNIIALIPCS